MKQTMTVRHLVRFFFRARRVQSLFGPAKSEGFLGAVPISWDWKCG